MGAYNKDCNDSFAVFRLKLSLLRGALEEGVRQVKNREFVDCSLQEIIEELNLESN